MSFAITKKHLKGKQRYIRQYRQTQHYLLLRCKTLSMTFNPSCGIVFYDKNFRNCYHVSFFVNRSNSYILMPYFITMINKTLNNKIFKNIWNSENTFALLFPRHLFVCSTRMLYQYIKAEKQLVITSVLGKIWFMRLLESSLIAFYIPIMVLIILAKICLS